jgi:uncharacterized protein (UPF0335 family)
LPLQHAIRKSFESELNKRQTPLADVLNAVNGNQQTSRLVEKIKALEEENKNLKKTLQELVYGSEKIKTTSISPIETMSALQKVCLKLRDNGKKVNFNISMLSCLSLLLLFYRHSRRRTCCACTKKFLVLPTNKNTAILLKNSFQPQH